MMLPNRFGAPEWFWPVCVLMVIGLILVGWSYFRSELSMNWKLFLAVLKLAAFSLLGICLLEPLSEFEQVDPGANQFVILADSSQSLQIKDRGSSKTRLERAKSKLIEASWMDRLGEQFDLRKYVFGSRIESVDDFEILNAEQRGSNLMQALQMITDRYRNRPLAGVLLFTDGNATDWDPDFDFSNLPPIYVVSPGMSAPAADIGLTEVASSQTNFESAPVTITATGITHGYKGKSLTARLLDYNDNELQTLSIKDIKDETPFAIRFQLKPEERGINVYRITVGETGVEDLSAEATELNNARTVVVDRGRGPFRVLYVSGRPNWEYKFLRRALSGDHEVELVGLIRLAKREPKFTFRDHRGDSTNSIYRGFGNEDDQTAEQYDEPVLMQLDTADAAELRDGFPKNEETLFKYDAVVIDDLEAEFFTQDQKSLLQQFVSRRGGGLLMLGGQESFGQGNYDHTAIGEMLPIYLDHDGSSDPAGKFRLKLTREGWIQPWVRVNPTESAEKKRLTEMPDFQTINHASSIKPGATVLATVVTGADSEFPALAVQRYGAGKTAALLIGDLWRWQLQTKSESGDLQKSWRQTMRWLVSEVSRRVEVEVKPQDDGGQSVDIQVQIRDELFRPLDNAHVSLTVVAPDEKEIPLTLTASSEEAGQYEATFVAKQEGAYRVRAEAKDETGELIENRESGWVAQPSAAELKRLSPNIEVMNTISAKTGGEVIALDRIGAFSTQLKNRKAELMTTRTKPWWHQWYVFVTAISLLVAEWGLRRWKGEA